MHLQEVEFATTSQPCSFEDYCLKRYDPELIINLMVGDFQRIALYPAMGFQAEEQIPDEVNGAFERLVAAAFLQEYHELFGIAAALCVLAGLVAALTLGPRPQRLTATAMR